MHPFYLQQIQLLTQISPNTVKALYAPRSPELVKELLDMEIEDRHPVTRTMKSMKKKYELEKLRELAETAYQT